MKTYLLNLWDNARTSYWFVPSLLTAAAFGLSLVMPLLDSVISESGSWLPTWILTTNGTARATLSAMASAMIAVTGTVFSITIVTLSLTSQQFGPRLLRRFMFDLTTQFTLGVFVSTGFYCLMLLRVVGADNNGIEAPHLSVFIGIVLVVFSMVMLIIFIHHVAVLIQAPQVVAGVGSDLDDAIVRLFPESAGRAAKETDAQESACHQQAQALGEPTLVVPSQAEGYLQAIAADSMVQWACQNELLAKVRARPGDFVAIDSPLAELWVEQELAEDDSKRDQLVAQLNEMFIVGVRRTPRQDVECAVNELVEVAVRALSPGINDPFTAINCVDRLAASLGRLARREIPSAYRCDSDGQLRVIARPVKFANVLDAAFNQIRQHGHGSVAVTIRVLEALSTISQHVQRDEDREAIHRHAKMLLEVAETFSEASDRQEVQERYDELMQSD